MFEKGVVMAEENQEYKTETVESFAGLLKPSGRLSETSSMTRNLKRRQRSLPTALRLLQILWLNG